MVIAIVIVVIRCGRWFELHWT